MKLFHLALPVLLMSAPLSFAEESADVPSLTAKAEAGEAAAQLSLAICYRDGKGVPQEHAKAMHWAHRAADQGNSAAMDFIGWMFFTGTGVAHQPKLAAGYFAAAAEDSAQAAWNLGQCHFAAQGVVHDVPKALELWRQAAEMGHGRAASTAAMVSLAGDGVAADPAAARRLAEHAAALGDPNGLVVLGEILYQAGELEQARAAWTTVAAMKPVEATGHPEQSGDRMAAQQGADLLKLIEWRRREAERGAFALVPVPHVHQGWNNCGATSCAIFARAQGRGSGSWEFKKLCPSPMGTGTDWSDLVNAAREIGLRWKLVTFPPDDDGFAQAASFARGELDAGRPLVIDFKYIGPQYPDGEAGHTLLLTGYLAADDLYILCNPAIATPGLQLITAADLKHYWRSDGYSAAANGVMCRPAIVLEQP